MAMKRDLLFGLLLLPACVLAADGPGFVAGLQPDRRPAGFATIRAEPPAPVQALARGIEGYSAGQFAWFAQQGRWYTPFGSPGSTGPYDIRRLHATEPAARPPKAAHPAATR